MILLIDNYDSFSYNLYQLIGSIRDDIKVIRNDELTVKEIEALNPEYIFISPGPGRPEDAGVCVEAIKYFAGKVPIMGICLGHQAITLAFGGVVTYAKELMHGKTSEITICETDKTQTEIEGDIREIHPSDRGLGTVDVYRGLPEKITVARYHSLAADRDSLPEELVVTAVTEDGEVMSLRHRDYKVVGLQYHPESVLTPRGRELIMNFLTD